MAQKKVVNQQLVVKENPRSTEEAIRKRAYEIFCVRNGGPGSEIDDWLKAENEIKEMRATTG
jgi:hypothetical protein